MRDLDEALELLHFGFQRIVREPDAILAKQGLSRVHHRILYFVRTRGPLTPTALGEVLGVSKQALHGPLGELTAKELVIARVSPKDARRRLLQLTSRGRELERSLSGIQRGLFEHAFDTVGRRSERGFRDVMRALAGAGPLRERPAKSSR